MGAEMSEATMPPAVGAVAPVRVRVAAIWRRTAAGLFDVVLLSVVFVGLFVAVSLVLGEPLPRLSQIGPDYFVDAAVSGHAKTAIGLVVLAISAFSYFFTFHSLRGQTPGKRLAGIRVIDAFGERPSLTRALVRTLACSLSAGLLGLGFVWIAFDRERRALHDWIADTYVVAGRGSKDE
jgi:uncharacterized RDD family membrane protein YckC